MKQIVTSNPHLRWLKLWLSVGWFLIATVIILSLIPPPSPQKIPLFIFPQGDKIAHFIAYFLLMTWFSQLYHVSRHRIYLTTDLIFLGIALELLQGLGGVRELDTTDILANTLGILAAWQLAKTRFSFILIRIENNFLKT